jgi:hypothetical protein
MELKETSNWTLETLKEFFEQKFTSLGEAVRKQETAYNERFASVNEFRNTLSDQQRTFMPRIETEILFKNHEDLHNVLNNKVDNIIKKLEKIENIKQGGNIVWAYIIAIISLIGVLISIAMNLSKI